MILQRKSYSDVSIQRNVTQAKCYKCCCKKQYGAFGFHEVAFVSRMIQGIEEIASETGEKFCRSEGGHKMTRCRSQ